MAYNNKAELKTLYVKQILEEETDAGHGLSMKRIIERLEQFGIKAERKSVYRDIEVLREFGCDIHSYQRNPVQFSKALTVRRSNALVTNNKLLASDHERALSVSW